MLYCFFFYFHFLRPKEPYTHYLCISFPSEMGEALFWCAQVCRTQRWPGRMRGPGLMEDTPRTQTGIHAYTRLTCTCNVSPFIQLTSRCTSDRALQEPRPRDLMQTLSEHVPSRKICVKAMDTTAKAAISQQWRPSRLRANCLCNLMAIFTLIKMALYVCTFQPHPSYNPFVTTYHEMGTSITT